jgi:plastocyanin
MKRLLFISLISVFMLIAIRSTAIVHIITVQDYTFQPSSLTNVTIGDTIHWMWINGTHTTTSLAIPSGAAAWDHPISGTSQNFIYTVTVSGLYNYECSIHGPTMGMVGSITVNSAPSLSVFPENQAVSQNAGSTSFIVTTSADWTTSCDSLWVIATHSGSGNGTINVQYEGNSSTSPRVAHISVISPGLPTQIVTVTQSGSTLGISENWQGTFSMYPNPTAGYVTINPGDLFQMPVQVSILDNNGRVIIDELSRSTTAFRYDLTGLPGGIYFVKIRSGQYFKVEKLIVASPGWFTR